MLKEKVYSMNHTREHITSQIEQKSTAMQTYSIELTWSASNYTVKSMDIVLKLLFTNTTIE